MIRKQHSKPGVVRSFLFAVVLLGAGWSAWSWPARGDNHDGCPPVQQRSALSESAQLPSEQIAELVATAANAAGYGMQLHPSRYGWVTLPVTCLWIEPVDNAGDPGQNRWWKAVHQAVSGWSSALPVRFTTRQDDAHVVVLRRTPPRLLTSSGPRARNGMARLSFEAVERNDGPRLEPRVILLVDPGLREAMTVGTAGHELGHAFGLWGHSPDPEDQMAVSSGSEPVQRPSQQDITTLQWLRRQPSVMGSTVDTQDMAAAESADPGQGL